MVELRVDLTDKADEELKVYMARNKHKSKEKALNAILEDIYHA